MKRSVAAFLAIVACGGAIAPAHAQNLAPIGGPYPPPFTATLSNNTPLAFGMDAHDVSRALGVPLNYVSGRRGDEMITGCGNRRRRRTHLPIAGNSQRPSTLKQLDDPWDKTSN